MRSALLAAALLAAAGVTARSSSIGNDTADTVSTTAANPAPTRLPNTTSAQPRGLSCTACSRSPTEAGAIAPTVAT